MESIKMIQKGNVIQIDYVGTFDDGTVFDASKDHDTPLEFEVGSGQIIPGLDKAVIGMKTGDSKDITIPAEEAYGPYHEEMVKKLPRKALAGDQEPKEGMTVMLTLPQGKFPARISHVCEEDVTIDLNHPLAGKALHFKIKIVSVK